MRAMPIEPCCSTTPAAIEEILFGRHREGADDDGVRLVADVHDPRQLGMVAEVFRDRLVADDHQVPAEERHGRVGESRKRRMVVDAA